MKNSNWLDPEPLQDLIRIDMEAHGSAQALADFVAWDERILRRVLTQKYVTIDLADRYCIATGRHLRDAYPELYPDDERLWFGDCPKCREHRAHIILAEGHLRIDARCRECGHRHFVEAPVTWRRRSLAQQGRLHSVRLIPEAAVREAHERYMATDLTILQTAAEFGFTKTTLMRSFGYYDLPTKDRRRTIEPEHIALAHLTLRVNGWRLRRPVLELRDQGVTYQEIGTQLGVSWQAAWITVRRAPGAGATRRVCINAECERFDDWYWSAPPDVAQVAPELQACPSCGGAGEPGELWEAAS